MAGPTRVFVPSIYGQHWYGTIYYGGQWVILVPPPCPPPPPKPPPVPPPPPPFPPPKLPPGVTPPPAPQLIPAGYSITPFTAQPVDYQTIFLSWTQPTNYNSSSLVDFRLLKNRYGFPVDQNDGTILLDSGGSGYPGNQFFDNLIIPGTMHYYGVYILINLSGGEVWYRAGFAACLAVGDLFDSTDWMLSRVPEWYKLFLNSELTTSDALNDSFFQQYMAIFGWGADYLQTQIALAQNVNDPMVIPVNWLGSLAGTLGVPFYPEIEAGTTRMAVANQAQLVRERGTLRGIEAEITQLTGWGADIQPGNNLMLEDDQADFLDPVYPAWSALISYDIGEYVSYAGFVYVSLVNNNLNVPPPTTGPPPTSNANWQAVYYTTNTGSFPLQYTPLSLSPTTLLSTNPNTAGVYVTVSGGTVTAITVNGVLTGLTSGQFFVNPGSLPLQWNSATNYNVGTAVTPTQVTYNGNIYTAAVASLNVTPTGTTSSNSTWTFASAFSGGTLKITYSVAPTTFSTTSPVLLNQTTAWQNTWEPLIDGMTNTHPTNATALQELNGILDPVSLEYEGNGLTILNNSGSTSVCELRSVSRTPSDISLGSVYPNTGQVIGDGIPVPQPLPSQLWDPTIQYATGTIVTYQGLPFLALKSSLNIAPPGNGVVTNEWQPVGYDARIALMLSGYASQVFTGTGEFAVTPYVLWFDETGTFISAVYVRTPSGGAGTSGTPSGLLFDSFALPSNWGLSLALTAPDIGTFTWVQEAGTWTCNALGGGCVVPASETVQTLAVVNYGSPTALVGITFTTLPLAGGYAGLCLRYSSNTSYIRCDQTGVYTVSGSAVTLLRLHSTAFMTGDRMTVSCNANVITVFQNGTQVNSVTTSFNNSRTNFGPILDVLVTTSATFGTLMPRCIMQMRSQRQRHQRNRRARVVGQLNTKYTGNTPVIQEIGIFT